MLRHLTSMATIPAVSVGPAFAVTWDTNDDGSVDAEEFAKGDVASVTFDGFDDDGDGAISPAEVGLTEPDEIFMAGDGEGDGLPVRGELSAATFVSYDRDRDEALDEDEWSALTVTSGSETGPSPIGMPSGGTFRSSFGRAAGCVDVPSSATPARVMPPAGADRAFVLARE